jgi:hypothetical protein
MAAACFDRLSTTHGEAVMTADPMKATKDFLDGIVAQKAPTIFLPESPSGSSSFVDLSDGALNSIDSERRKLSLGILRAAATHIPPPVTHIYEQEELSRTRGASIVKYLVNGGYMRVYQYHASRRGGAMKIPRVMDRGWAELSQFGMQPPQNVLGGGWEHNLCGKVLGAVGKRQHYRPSYEVPIGLCNNVRIDLVLAAINMARLYCQCCFSSAEREVEIAIKILSIIPAETGRLVMVCRDKAFLNAVSRLLKKADGDKQCHERISLKVFGDVLEHYYKKSQETLL